MKTITIDATGEKFTCEKDDTILRAALRAGIGLPYSCNVGSCGNCKIEVREGSVEHLRKDAPAWSERDQKRNKWLSCQSKPNSDCKIKFRADPSYIPVHKPYIRSAEIVSITSITHDIQEFSLKFKGDTSFLPGQYALLSMDGVSGARAYSMCNLPGEETWDFQIKKVPDGAATGQLFSMQVGDNLQLDGPYSTAYLRTDIPRDIILMAGGSGLSPMVSIARGAKAAGLLENQKLHFYYGGRGEVDVVDPLVLGEELAAQISFNVALSDAADSKHRKGFLHDAVKEDFGDDLKNYEIYFAGPAVMSAAIQKMAYDLGVPMTQLHFDEFF